MKGYPVFLTDLDTKRCVVIGGGPEAERKVAGLLECDASVTVISPDLTPTLHLWVQTGTLAWLARPYQPGDLQGAHLVIVTDGSLSIRAMICQEAEAERALLNVADNMSQSDFTAGAVMRQGALTIAISTNGCAPALAVRLRQQFERTLGPEYATFLAWLQDLREPLARQYPDFTERRARWYTLVDSDILALLKQGRVDLARQRLADLLAEAPGDMAEYQPEVQ